MQVSRPVKATAQAQHTAAVVNELSAVLQVVLQVRHSICDIQTVAHIGHSALHIASVTNRMCSKKSWFS